MEEEKAAPRRENAQATGCMRWRVCSLATLGPFAGTNLTPLLGPLAAFFASYVAAAAQLCIESLMALTSRLLSTWEAPYKGSWFTLTSVGLGAAQGIVHQTAPDVTSMLTRSMEILTLGLDCAVATKKGRVAHL